MNVPLTLAPPSALAYFGALVAEDDGFPLVEAAVLLGLDAEPRLDIASVLDEVDQLAARLRQRLPADASALHRLRSLTRYFFDELGFGANANDFYAPENSYLHRVLATRRGIPVSLGVLFMELGAQIGLPVQGVSFPGHFLVKVKVAAGEVVLDPLDGRSLDRPQLEERLEPYRREQGLVGDFDIPLGLFLQAAAPRDILARMLGNLKDIHRAAGDPVAGLAVQERLVQLLPQAWEERRDRGLLLADLGRPGPAADDLALYLRHCPEAADAPALSERLAMLRASPPPRWH